MATPSSDPVVIVSAARTPVGGFQGAFASVAAPELGAVAIKAAVEKSGVEPEEVSEVLMGCVLPAGMGQAPARQASRGGGLPDHVPCTTVNKMCGSGMKTVMMAYESLHARPSDIILAGGMESMTNAPYLLPKMRSGQRLGHGQVYDHMFLDGLEDAYDKGRLMGTFAEDCAQHHGFSREEQDAYALTSLQRARDAIASGRFASEIVPLDVTLGREQRTIGDDEQPPKAMPEKIPTLKPAFREGGSVTAANSSSISDGAAALVLTRRSHAEQLGLKPQAVIHGHAVFADAPNLFPTAPIGAIHKLLERTGWRLGEVDLFEINEAFAVVSMVAMCELGLDHAKVNVNGGACALGHPIGASGARILVTLIAALRDRGLRKGIAAICIGGGEATAMAVELLD